MMGAAFNYFIPIQFPKHPDYEKESEVIEGQCREVPDYEPPKLDYQKS